MVRIKRLAFLILALGALSNSFTPAKAAVPYPQASAPQAQDLGSLSAQSSATPISVTIVLGMRTAADAERLMVSQQTPGDPQFHEFLTADEFAARFAPTASEVARIEAALANYGLTTERTSALTLKVTGLPSDMERAFAVSLHSYQVPAHGNEDGYTFHAPQSRGTIPSEIAGSVSSVVGLDSRPMLRPHVRASTLARPRASSPAATGNPPGLWTVTDMANYYDVQPLYRAGISGKGRTIGIVTFASLTPSDPFAYWSAIGLDVDKNRLKIVNVDGGPGAPSDGSGSIETTLDVEQSGGLAPRAKIVVYQAPNNNQGFVDAFAAAVEANFADSISVSWGEWEWFDNLANSPVTDPSTGRTVSVLDGTHEQLVRAAIQGQTLFAASGDSGAYAANGSAGCFGPYDPTVSYSCNLTLSVAYPASDSAITAAGGTTLAGEQQFCLDPPACTQIYVVNIAQESVWGWDYLIGVCSLIGLDPISCGIYPVGSGGGVSVFFQQPSYQSGIPGVQRSQPGQVWQSTPAVAAAIGVPLTTFTLPANYRGRNVPDISLNADPDTGYVIYYTSSVSGFVILSGAGGTSFVAPQLNGITALLGEEFHGRLGLLNFALYSLARGNRGYEGRHPPLRAITAGDNWFYYGSPGYNPAAGLGTLDVTNFANSLRDSF